MGRKTLVVMVAGVMMMLALVSADCSGGGVSEAVSENVKRSIKVYESPT